MYNEDYNKQQYAELTNAIIGYKNNTFKKNKYDWKEVARKNQLPPNGEWFVWLILAGRGFGKTRTGAETIKMLVQSNKYKRIAILGNTIDDVRNVMLYGESGILNIGGDEPNYQISYKRMVWKNGAIAVLYSAENYEELRGAAFDLVWIDELAKFQKPSEVFEQILFCTRLGNSPKIIITTTPKPIKVLRDIMKMPNTVLTKGTTYENEKNLSPTFIENLKTMMDGKNIGRQEIYAEILDVENGYIWEKNDFIYKEPPDSNNKKVIISIDPAITNTKNSDETGIITLSKIDDKIYILEDSSIKTNPIDWVKIAIELYYRYNADYILVESNIAGDVLKNLFHSVDENISIRQIRASKNKSARAMPIAFMYKKKLIFHSKKFDKLEEQLLYYNGSEYAESDRLDALVWGVTDLINVVSFWSI